MSTLRALALAAGAAAGPRGLFPSQHPAATVLLGHRYFAPGEPKSRAIDRLRHQLEWLQSAYVPISVPDLIAHRAAGNIPDRTVIVTTDDALLDILEVADEFRAFGVPLAVFACTGWVTDASNHSDDDLLLRAVVAVQWYEGKDIEITLAGGHVYQLSAATKARNIDAILASPSSTLQSAEELCAKIRALSGPVQPRRVCSWAELQNLSASGVYIGAHSVSHVPIAKMSATRQRFEIAESQRAIEARIGTCKTFAYPYGMQGTYNDVTFAELKRAGFEAAFVSHSDVVTDASPALAIPRIALPDDPMPLYEFKARVRGGGIVARRMKQKARQIFLQDGQVQGSLP